MTQFFMENGEAIPVTVVEAGPCTVIQKKTVENDGYNAIRVGYEDVKEHRLNKPDLGIFKKHQLNPKKYLREFKTENIEEFNIGDEIKVDIFEEGDKVDVTAISKGKGFAGAIKRWKFSRGPMSHGSRFHRRPGSSGAVDPARVFKGKKRPGQLGAERVTIQNLEIVKVYPENNLILIKGSIPGPKKALVFIKNTVKSGK